MHLDREEYIEQAHFFRVLGERLQQQIAAQELLVSLKEELLSTARLPLALDYLAAELRHRGLFSTAMARLSHYFTPFQTFVMEEAESERGRFDLYIGLQILEREANYRAEGAAPQGIFFFHFEAVSRNRLGYDRGLKASAEDPIFNEDWRDWILTVRRQIGLVDLADMIYVRSQLYVDDQARREHYQQDEDLEEPPDTSAEPARPPAVLFGEKEGKIALANRRRDPLLFFAALQRHLSYPAVPRPKPVDDKQALLPQLARRVERMESRIKMLEEEVKQGLDITKFYGASRPPRVDLDS